MAKTIDIISIALLVLAAAAFALGMYSLGDRKDLNALYWLVVGGLMLKAATDLLKPKSGGR